MSRGDYSSTGRGRVAAEAPGGDDPGENPALRLWEGIFQDSTGVLALWFLDRENPDEKKNNKTRYFEYPGQAKKALEHAYQQSERGWEAYFAAHLLKKKRRIKDNAKPLRALYADADGAVVPPDKPQPAIRVASSPGKVHLYWPLDRELPSEEAEELNRQVTYAIGADKSGWDLSQVLRIPGTRNYKYEGAPVVELVECNGPAYSPEHLREAFPEPEPSQPGSDASYEPDEPPVVLGPEALEWWMGEKFKEKYGGVDRSATLLMIGRLLYDANATRRVIADTLAERDVALGYEKYSNRDDAEKQYHAIVDELQSQGRGGWPDPKPIVVPVPEAMPLEAEMLPEPLAPWVYDAAERMDNAPPDFVAAAAVVTAGSLLGRKVGIRPKAKDDWLVVPNLWGALVGIPAAMKTPALEVALKPLKMLAADARKKHEDELADYKLDQMLVDAQRTALKDELKSTAKKVAQKKAEKEGMEALRGKLEALEDVEKPTPARYSTNDITSEKLAEIMAENPDGLLVYRDELMGWLRSLEKQGREGDRAFFLESWAGTTTSYEVDRIGRGYIYIPAMCLSLLGGIQPGPLETYVTDAIEESEKSDGLLQRFQVLVWPTLGEWRAVDRYPQGVARELAYNALKGLATLDAEAFGATFDEEFDKVPYVRFSGEAQEIFDDWRAEFEPRLREGELPSALESHLLKYRSLFPSLALIFEALNHVASGSGEARGVVGQEAALQGAVWCRYLESHALKLYAPALYTPEAAARALLGHIQAGDVKSGDTTRSIYHYGWTSLKTADEVDGAVRVLEEHGWVRRQRVQPKGGGRPSERIILNPELRR